MIPNSELQKLQKKILLLGGGTQSEIARRCNTNRQMVHYVIRGKMGGLTELGKRIIEAAELSVSRGNEELTMIEGIYEALAKNRQVRLQSMRKTRVSSIISRLRKAGAKFTVEVEGKKPKDYNLRPNGNY